MHIQNVAIMEMENHSFIHSCNFKYLLNFCYEPEVIWGVANSVVNFLLYILVEKKDDKQITQVKKKVVSDIIEKNKNKERKGIENRYLLFITAKQISTNLQCEKYTSITSQTRWVRTQALLS